VIDKAPSADLEVNQTDEADLGITYMQADQILALMLQGYRDETVMERGFTADEVATVRRRLEATHWKRHLPTTAVLSSTAINEFYLRPVDF
jgi:NH3-dependent NAD+ synthetase